MTQMVWHIHNGGKVSCITNGGKKVNYSAKLHESLSLSAGASRANVAPANTRVDT